MCNHILHVCQLLLKVFKFCVIAVDSLLVCLILAHQPLLLELDLLQLLCEPASQVLQLLPIVNMLLELVADEFAVLFRDLLLLEELPLEFPEVIQF